MDKKIYSYLSHFDLARCAANDYANYISGPRVHTYIKVTVTGTDLEDFNEPIFVSCFMSGIQKALDTFALPVNHFTLPPVADDDGSKGKMPDRQYSPCSSTSLQLTIDLSSDDDLLIGDDNSDGISDSYPVSTDVDMKVAETEHVAVRKSRQLQGLTVEEEE